MSQTRAHALAYPPPPLCNASPPPPAAADYTDTYAQFFNQGTGAVYILVSIPILMVRRRARLGAGPPKPTGIQGPLLEGPLGGKDPRPPQPSSLPQAPPSGETSSDARPLPAAAHPLPLHPLVANALLAVPGGALENPARAPNRRALAVAQGTRCSAGTQNRSPARRCGC